MILQYLQTTLVVTAAWTFKDAIRYLLWWCHLMNAYGVKAWYG